jgi:uncharacterized protein YndB with AHSA1/START domain
MIDIVTEIAAVRRAVGSGRIAAGEGRAVRLSRTFDAPVEDVWDALTRAERITRWFLPISGDLHAGGRYQLDGNAGGQVLACEPPRRFRVTWVYGEAASPEDVTEVEVRLTAGEDGSTTVELEHTAIVPDDRWAEYGPGAVGVGWDGAFLGLTLHLRTGEGVADPMAWQLSQEGRDFSTRSSEAWGAANVAAGADPDAAASAVANTTAFYTTDPTAAPENPPEA